MMILWNVEVNLVRVTLVNYGLRVRITWFKMEM